MINLRGITWDHPRGHDPLLAASTEYAQQSGTHIHWDARPLRDFEDLPASRLAGDYDLLALDHPSLGDAARQGVLVAVDEHMGGAEFESLSTGTVGPSQLSYTWGGRSWALALDAACMVSAVGPRFIDRPQRWSDALDAARRIGRERVMVPANPTHVYCAVLSLCEALSGGSTRLADGTPSWWTEDGFDSDLLAAAIDLEREILSVSHPGSVDRDPIEVLDLLARGDLDYVPLVFGYVTYSLGGAPVRFVNPPDGAGTLTGGVGLGVSALRGHREAALAAAVHLTSEAVQSGVFASAGGQPARTTAWDSPTVNERAGDFFAGTRATMDRAFLRPRGPGYPEFQIQASMLLHEAVVEGVDGATAAQSVNALWRRRAGR